MPVNQYETWAKIKVKYPNQWVVIRDAEYADHFHVELLGGVVIAIAMNQDELFDSIPNDYDGALAARHTSEGVGANGLLLSGV